MSEPYYYHYFGKKHTRNKKKKDKKLPLVIDIQESTEGALLVYLIKVMSQKYKYTDFIKDDDWHRFVASNGFVLVSDHCPGVDEMNPPDTRSRPYENKLFVRGLDHSSDNNVVKVYGISYIEELKIAVAEYNEYVK